MLHSLGNEGKNELGTLWSTSFTWENMQLLLGRVFSLEIRNGCHKLTALKPVLPGPATNYLAFGSLKIDQKKATFFGWRANAEGCFL